MSEIILYDAACRAIANAKSVDEVRDIRDRAEAMRHYQRMAKNRDLEMDAAEIRMRAERRLGQMITAQRETVGLHKGGRPRHETGTGEEPVSPPTLQQAGIDKKLSSHAQKMAAVPAAEFEARLGAWREEVSAAGARVTMDLLKIGEKEQQRQARHDLAQTLSDTSHQLTGTRKFPCVYADPAVRRKAGIGDRAYENHYPTMDWDEILALPIREMVLPDAWLFLWLPRAHVLALHKVRIPIVVDDGEVLEGEVRLPLAWAIARAWGFDDFSTLAVWDKTGPDNPDEHGTGLIFWDQSEILCLFKKGRGLPMPEPAQKFGSMHRERSRPLGHSRKPQFYREMIASMTGGLPVLELFARADAEHPLPANWEAWGNEAPAGISEAAE